MIEARSEKLAQELFVLLQPTRWKIIKALKEAEEPLYIKEIADKIHQDWKVVSFHLSSLADAGFVEGEFRSIERPKENPGRGKAGKFYKITSKVDEILSHIGELRL